MIDSHTSFGLWLKERRKQLDLTQAELANCAGCSVMTIRKIEADERRPSRQIAELLAACLEIAPDDQPTFLKVARAELRVDRLPTSPPSHLPTSLPPYPHLGGQSPATSPPPPGRAVERSPLRSDHLPISPSPLLGRDQELASLAQLLQNPQCRLLTLIGPGGVGKTALAIEAAAHQRDDFADGVYFVSLASVSSTELLIPTIASALDFTFYNPADLQTQLLNYFREKSMLLVLDNFEQLLPSAQAENEAGLELLLTILEVAPALKLLVTSRERLHLQREWVFELHGLPAPPNAQIDGLESYSAVALFLQNARRVQANFEATAADLAAIVRICQLMDGLPLGLELAAAWVRVLSCQEIVREIERGLDFLTGSARDLPERQRSLQLTFDHSWKLLSAEEQAVMRRLSVFRGGFQREAAEQVAGATLPVLMALVDKSLLRRPGPPAMRYDLHELVRQYAAAHLQQLASEEQATRESHCDFFTGLLHQAESRLKGADQPGALADLGAEVDNLRLAWDWAVGRQDVARLQRAAYGLFLFYLSRNWSQEGAELLQRAAELFQATIDRLATPPVELLAALGRILAYQSWLRMWSGQLPLAQELASRNTAMLRPLNAPAALSDALRVQGVLHLMTGDLAAGRANLEESLAIKRGLGDDWEVAIGLTYLGRAIQVQGNHEQAYNLIAEAAAIVRRHGDRLSTARALGFLSASALALGRPDQARRLAEESLTISREIGDHWSVANGLNELGLIAQAQADAAGAVPLFEESLPLYRQIGDHWSMARTLNHLAEAFHGLGQPVEARRAFLAALQTALEARATPIALDALLGLAALHAQEQQPELALELLLHTLRHPALRQETRGRAEELRATLEAQLTLPQQEAVQARAQARDFEAIVTEIIAALELL